MAPTLGVLITYYNEREMLTECLESLLANTELPDEILVYDDASDYPAQDYTPDHPLIRVVRGERNGGMVYARKQSLRLATSEYMHFHDADDWFMPTWVERVRAALLHADYIVTHGYVQYEDGQRELYPHLKSEQLQVDFRTYAVSHGLNSIGPTFHRSLAQHVLNERGDNLKGVWDFYSNALMAAHAQRFQFIPEPLYVIRMRANSLSRSADCRRRLDMDINAMKALQLLYDDLPMQRLLIVENIAKQAGYLYNRGSKAEAAEGFAFVRRLGRPTYSWMGQPWRAIARTLGPMTAYRLFRIYAHPSLVAARGRLKTFIKGQTS